MSTAAILCLNAHRRVVVGYVRRKAEGRNSAACVDLILTEVGGEICRVLLGRVGVQEPPTPRPRCALVARFASARYATQRDLFEVVG